MTKKQLEELDAAAPWGKEQILPGGWRAPLELHNGNIYVLVFWKGRLMKLEDAPKQLNKKYFDKHKGRTLNVYEWTLLKRYYARATR